MKQKPQLKYKHKPIYKTSADNKIIASTIHLVAKTNLSSVNVGRAPVINARVVSPKAKPDLPGSIFAIAVRVTGMVMLNKKIPKIESRG